MLHGDRLPVPENPDNFAIYSEDKESVSSNSEKQQPSASRNADYLPITESSNHEIKEGELNDLTRHLELPNNKVERLASSLQQWNLLHHSVKVTSFRTRNQVFERFLVPISFSPTEKTLMV